ncbi:hypothetical protein [Leifsonia sp. Leaf264]|uniref:hypothetical protein n=1 Tax=Leifsonia sp. Leaf264 TaxID=1736314 RepID=UPI0006F6CAE8|nr:hypothetical protein [Leifsonia sp. Leaf264]KQO98308.1 hypothetical protein ASF30_09620 [Leifsonia sp. Leaf264]
MTSINDTMRRFTEGLLEDAMEDARQKVRDDRDDRKLRKKVEREVEFMVFHMFSAAAIGRAAGQVGGGRRQAVGVLLAALGADPIPGAPRDQVCGECGRDDVVGLAGFDTRPQKTICQDCGAVDVKP